jgi:phosphomannomutase
VTVAVGYDSRISSPALCEAAVKGITTTGHHAVVTGLSTTPSMFALLKDEARMQETYCHGSIMLTASHLPFNRNGLKFFSHNGGLESSDVKEILEMAYSFRFAETTILGETKELCYLDTYAQGLVNKVRTATGEDAPLKGKKIIVDASNGASGFFVDKVLNTRLIKSATYFFCVCSIFPRVTNENIIFLINCHTSFFLLPDCKGTTFFLIMQNKIKKV